jgi:hypothetical protein
MFRTRAQTPLMTGVPEMARSLMLAMFVAVCSLLIVVDFADAGCRRRRGCGGGGYSHGCGGCGGYSHGGCGGSYGCGGCGGGVSYGGCGGSYGCGGGGCQGGVHYDGQPIPDGGTAPPPPPANGGSAPPPPQATVVPGTHSVIASTTSTMSSPRVVTYASARRGLFGRLRY